MGEKRSDRGARPTPEPSAEGSVVARPVNDRGARAGAPVTGGAVHLRVGTDGIELQLTRDFSRADVEIVRAIPGRKWIPQRLVWLLPHTPQTLQSLERAFGSRLARLDPPKARGSSDGAGVPASGTSRSAAAATGMSHVAEAVRHRTDGSPGTGADGGVRSGPSAGTAGSGECERDAQALLSLMRAALRMREYSRRTEQAYIGWTRRFLDFLARRVPRPGELDVADIHAFLEHLARERRLAARSRNQAASALTFLLREVLRRDDAIDIPRAKGSARMPIVLSHREVLRVLRELSGKYSLIAMLLYSAGLRVQECLRIRIKDVDFELRQILVRDGKGRKDRYVPLANRTIERLRAQIEQVRDLHERDRAAGHGWAALPYALHRKDPRAGYEFGWQWLFPASTSNTDPTTGREGRWPLHVTAVQREVKRAVRRSGITKRATCHTFRHSFATEALRGGCDIRTLQHVLGHKNIRTTMIYLHVVEQTGLFMRSPLDRPDDPEDIDREPPGTPWTGVVRHRASATLEPEPGRPGRRRERARRASARRAPSATQAPGSRASSSSQQPRDDPPS